LYHLKKSLGNTFSKTGQLPNGPPSGYANASNESINIQFFLRGSSEQDGSICQCLQPGSFGKNCEYQLPRGQTFEETLKWQFDIRDENQEKVQIYGDVVCHETLQCDSGVLCLDWRDICDGIQQCLSGKDEENCDLLEMNQCDQEEEYRCMNGMCIPQAFFLDGDLDCLDWSDEMRFKKDEKCPQGSVNTECDDHVCLFEGDYMFINGLILPRSIFDTWIVCLYETNQFELILVQCSMKSMMIGGRYAMDIAQCRFDT
jgi:hypothetical protein